VGRVKKSVSFKGRPSAGKKGLVPKGDLKKSLKIGRGGLLSAGGRLTKGKKCPLSGKRWERKLAADMQKRAVPYRGYYPTSA